MVIRYLREGWPNRSALPMAMIPFYDKRDELYEEAGILFCGNKLIIPTQERPHALRRLHHGHQGMEKTKALARQIIYWPGINQDIEQLVRTCGVCQKYRRSNTKEPIRQHEVPQYPWVKVGADIFHFGSRDFLVVIDYYSKFPEVCPLQSKSAVAIIQALKSIFGRQGIPETLIADNVPFAAAAVRRFATEWNFEVVTSSPRYPQSNGQAEKYVGIVKMLMRKCQEDHSDLDLALLRYRNTPISGLTYSPAQMLYNRRLRDDIPVRKRLLQPQVPTASRAQLMQQQRRQALYYNRHARYRPTFEKGESVRVKLAGSKEWAPAEIQRKYPGAPRSYVLLTENGQTLRRNKHMINKTGETVNIKPPYPDPGVYNNTQQDNMQITPGVLQSNGSQSSTPEITEDTATAMPRRSGRCVQPPVWHRDYVVDLKGRM